MGRDLFGKPVSTFSGSRPRTLLHHPSRVMRAGALASRACVRSANQGECHDALHAPAVIPAPAVPLVLSSGLARAVELNSAAVTYELPDQIQWGPPNPAGAQNVVLTGDPAKEGLYIVMGEMDRGQPFQPSPFSPSRSFHHGAKRNLVGGHQLQVRS